MLCSNGSIGCVSSMNLRKRKNVTKETVEIHNKIISSRRREPYAQHDKLAIKGETMKKSE